MAHVGYFEHILAVFLWLSVLSRPNAENFLIGVLLLYCVVYRQNVTCLKGFYRATRMHSADYAVERCLYVCLSHTGILLKGLYISLSSNVFKRLTLL